MNQRRNQANEAIDFDFPDQAPDPAGLGRNAFNGNYQNNPKKGQKKRAKSRQKLK